MSDDQELSSRLYAFLFHSLDELRLRIMLLQADMESFYLDLEDAYDLTGAARQAVLGKLEMRFRDLGDRSEELEALRDKEFHDWLERADPGGKQS